MPVKISGMGWVTPLGVDLADVSRRIVAGEIAETRELSNGDSHRKHRYFPVPEQFISHVGKNARLRRSSAITYFTVAAGLTAIENAGLELTPGLARRTGVVFAIASGGVVYTRKFYADIVQQGANAASPLLFPETVYNAPASHIAALLGIDGLSYTLVGDGSVGISALKLAEQLLAADEVDRCLVIGGEEVDWVLSEAYRTWRLVTQEQKIVLNSGLGTLLGEGAAALLLGREGRCSLERIHPGVSFFDRSQASNAIRKVHADLADASHTDLVVSCANGTFIDVAERAAIADSFPNANVLYPKQSLGDALGAGALIQTILAALAVERGDSKRALVSCLGFNQQASGAVVNS